MTSALARLVAPLGEDAFLAALRARRPLFAAAVQEQAYPTPIDWDGVMLAVTSGVIPPDRLRLTRNGKMLPDLLYRDGNVVRAQVIAQTMTTVGSLMANGIEAHIEPLGDLCADVARQLGEHVSAGVVATSGPGGALRLHYDDADLLILQVEGRKRWIIQDAPAVDPVPGLNPAPGDPDAPTAIDVVIAPGDRLFVPAGYRHRCENQDERSLHIGIFFWPLTLPRILALLRAEAIGDADTRRPLRSGAAAEAEVREELLARVNALSFDDLRALHRATKPTV